MIKGNKQLKADMMLLLVTLFWGVSYLLIDISLEEVEAFNLNVLRFGIAFIIAGIVAFHKIKNVNRITILYSALLGAILTVVYLGATYAVMYTSLSNAGFLCAMTVVFTPIFGFIFKKQKPAKRLILVVIICFIGIGLLSLNEEFKPALGDIFAIMCAVAYAIHLLVTETAVKKEEVSAFQLGVYQLGFTALFNLIVCFIIETPKLPTTAGVWTSVLVLAVFCTGLSFIVQAVAQQYTSASHVGIIFTLEPVFAGFIAFFIAGEVLAPRGYLGAALLISGLFIMEIDWSRLLKKPSRESSEN